MILKAKNMSVWLVIWTLGSMPALLAFNFPSWIAVPIVLFNVIAIPGFLLALVFDIPGEDTAAFAFYSVSLGVGFLLIGGLLFDWLLPYTGVSHPLAALPVILFITAADVLMALFVIRTRSSREIRFPKPLDATNIIFFIFPFLFVFLAAAGAERLNNGQSGTLTVIMLFLIAAYVVALSFAGSKIRTVTHMASLYCIGLALLLMYSLRSAHVFGWDINMEYEVFRTTLRNLRWKMSYYPGLDYNACISITILPAILQVLTKISPEYVFKFLFQAIFAILPIGSYLLAKRYMSSSFAFLAGFLVAAQTWFFEQMPALIRQEIAFVMFSALVCTVFDQRIKPWTRIVLLSLFTTGVVLSHYSTAYVLVALLALTLAISWIARFVSRNRHNNIFSTSLRVLGIAVAILFFWQVIVTRTIGTFNAFAGIGSAPQTNTAQLPATSTVISSSAPSAKASLGKIISAALFGTSDPNTTSNIVSAQTAAMHLDLADPAYGAYPDGATTPYQPEPIPQNTPSTPVVPSLLISIIKALEWISKLLLVDVFPLIGIVVLFAKRKSETGKNENADFAAINAAAYLLLVIMIVTPYLQEYYNFSRLYLQMFMLLSTLSIYGALAIPGRIRRYALVLLGVVAAIMFLTLSGLFDQFDGGQKRITMNQPPSTLAAPYISDAEAAGAAWLASHRNPADPVQADIVASLRLQSFADISSPNPDIFPETIQKNSYVYLIGANMDGEAFYEYNNNLLVFNYPLNFLRTHKDLIYSSGDAQIYR